MKTKHDVCVAAASFERADEILPALSTGGKLGVNHQRARADAPDRKVPFGIAGGIIGEKPGGLTISVDENPRTPARLAVRVEYLSAYLDIRGVENDDRQFELVQMCIRVGH